MKFFNCILLATLCAGCTSKTPAVVGTPAVDQPAADASKATDEVVIIDVRTDKEWESGHLDSAVHIPYTEIAEKIEGVADSKDTKIVLYCAAGGRAGKAKKVLDDLGYSHVENAGGYDDVLEKYGNGTN